MRAHTRQPHSFLLGIILCVGCGLPSLPLEPEEQVDAGDEHDADLPLPHNGVCVPNERFCAGSSRPGVFVACAADGSSYADFECPGDQICRTGTGECFSISQLCGPDDVFKLSTREVFFEPAVDDGKSSSAIVSLTNCTRDVISVRTFKITTPRHDDGQPVFAEAPGNPPLQGLNISPGATIDHVLELAPRKQGWPEVGDLQITADSPSRGLGFGQARLSTSTWCLTAPSIIDLGTFDAGDVVTADLTLHNCGARSLFVSGVTAGTTPGASDEVITVEDDGVASLAARAHAKIPVTFTRATPGRVYAALTPRLSPQQIEQLGGDAHVPMVHVQGYARAPGECDPTIEPPAAEGGGKIGDLATFALFDTIVSFGVPEQFARGWFASWSSPSGQLHQSTDREAFFFPPRVGSYAISLDMFSPDSIPACERGEYKLKVPPSAPLYVELTWDSWDTSTSKDPVPGDRGPGHGIDLDLHVLDAEIASRDECWADASADCWGRIDTASNNICSNGARVRALSQSGGSAEVITHDGLSPLRLGVYLKNLGQFTRAEATVRVWWLGRRLHPEGGWTRALSSHDEFWYVGDFADGQFDLVDGASPTGFPPCAP